MDRISSVKLARQCGFFCLYVKHNGKALYIFYTLNPLVFVIVVAKSITIHECISFWTNEKVNAMQFVACS